MREKTRYARRVRAIEHSAKLAHERSCKVVEQTSAREVEKLAIKTRMMVISLDIKALVEMREQREKFHGGKTTCYMHDGVWVAVVAQIIAWHSLSQTLKLELEKLEK